MTQEVLSSLKALGDQLRLQLHESPEFRALTVVERTILELSEILNSLSPPPDGAVSSMLVDKLPNEPSAAISSIQQHAPPPYRVASPVLVDKSSNESSIAISSIQQHAPPPDRVAPPALVDKPSNDSSATISSIQRHTAPAPDRVASLMPVDKSSSEPSATISSIRQRAAALVPGATNSQNRMAKAIAETIAAKAAPFNTPPAATPRFDYVLSAAS